MFRKLFALVLSIFIAASLHSTALASDSAKNSAAANIKYKNTITAARETMWKAITTGHGNGASAAVIDRGKIVYSESFGVAERAKNSMVNKYTRFNIGSTSKMFVTAAVMMLVDDGKIHLDEPLVKYLPEFTMKDPRHKNITVRMLFNHSSGMPGTSTPTGYEIDDDTHKTLLDCLKRAYLKHDPGAMSMYCNDGFTLAEILVEKVSGVKFMDFIDKRIFKPLAMKNSGASTGELQPANAAFYYETASGKKHPHEVMMVYGAGGISSTAEDLCRFGYSFCNGGRHILSKASLAEMRKTQPTKFSDKLKGPQMMQEMGWEYVNLATYAPQGVQVMSKGGNTTYNSSCMQVVPAEGIVVSIIISGNASGESLARPILDGIIKDRKLAEPKTAEIIKPAEAKTIPAEFPAIYEGYYTNNTKIFTLKFDAEKKGFAIYPAVPVSEATAKKTAAAKKDGASKNAVEPLYTFIYDGEFFHNYENKIKCYLTEINGDKYVITSNMADYEVDSILFQKLEPVTNPPSMKIDLNGKTWLFRNLKPYIVYGTATPMTSNLIDGLPGYVEFIGAKKIEAVDFASIAATAFRDQMELYLVENNGEIWAQMGFCLLSQESCAKKVSAGINRVFIGQKNYNEWLKLEKGAILDFEIPEKARLIVVKSEAPIFDSAIDENKEIYAPEGSFIFCAGKFGDVFKVNAK